MMIFWCKKPNLLPSNIHDETNYRQFLKNVGRGIVLTVFVGIGVVVLFVASRFFLRPNTTEVFALITVIIEELVNLPPVILFILSNPTLKDFVKSWLKKRILPSNQISPFFA